MMVRGPLDYEYSSYSSFFKGESENSNDKCGSNTENMIILKAFGIDANYIKRKTKEISDWLNPKVKTVKI
jgi:hypothetical protein